MSQTSPVPDPQKVIYVTSLHRIRHKRYKLLNVPLTYHPYPKKLVRDIVGNPVAFDKAYDDPYNCGPYNATVEIIVDMYINKIGFSFSSRDDMIEIRDDLRAYYDWLKHYYQEMPPDHRAFHDRSLPLFSMLNEKIKRIMYARSMVKGNKQEKSIPKLLASFFGAKRR